MFRSFRWNFLFLVIIVLFCTKFSAEAIENDHYIVGGKRVGPVTLGENLSKYEKFLGPRSTKSPNLFYYPRRSMLLLVRNGKIQGITVFSPDYRTKKGVRVGSPLSALEKHYGNYLETDAGSLIYSDLGLAFFEEGGKITRVMVVTAQEDQLLGDKMLIPGTRAGNIKIGMDVDLVKKYWGEPDKVEEIRGKLKSYQYRAKAIKLLIADGIIHGIQVNSYKFRTPEGIGINSTRQQVVKTYGNRYRQVENSLMYNSLGIGFYFHQDQVIEVLLTYRKQ